MMFPELQHMAGMPGYKPVLRGLVKGIIQQLVEELASQTGEETVMLTASITNGTVTSLGSGKGKVFLDSRDDIKTQFLDFCKKKGVGRKEVVKQSAPVESKSPAERRKAAPKIPKTATSSEEWTADAFKGSSEKQKATPKRPARAESPDYSPPPSPIAPKQMKTLPNGKPLPEPTRATTRSLAKKEAASPHSTRSQSTPHSTRSQATPHSTRSQAKGSVSTPQATSTYKSPRVAKQQEQKKENKPAKSPRVVKQEKPQVTPDTEEVVPSDKEEEEEEEAEEEEEEEDMEESQQTVTDDEMEPLSSAGSFSQSTAEDDESFVNDGFDLTDVKHEENDTESEGIGDSPRKTPKKEVNQSSFSDWFSSYKMTRGKSKEVDSGEAETPTEKPEESVLTAMSPKKVTFTKRRDSPLSVGTPGKFMCEECGRVLNSKRQYREHMMDHTGKYPNQCDICHKRFKRLSDMRNHRLRHSRPGRVKKTYVCDVCGRQCNNSKQLKEHLFDHSTGPKPYPCDLCHKTFKRKTSMQSHRRVHLKPKKPKLDPSRICEFCGKVYKGVKQYREHVMNHTGVELPHTCDVCKKGFKRKREMLDHYEALHLNQANRKCRVCSTPYKWRKTALECAKKHEMAKEKLKEEIAQALGNGDTDEIVIQADEQTYAWLVASQEQMSATEADSNVVFVFPEQTETESMKDEEEEDGDDDAEMTSVTEANAVTTLVTTESVETEMIAEQATVTVVMKEQDGVPQVVIGQDEVAEIMIDGFTKVEHEGVTEVVGTEQEPMSKIVIEQEAVTEVVSTEPGEQVVEAEQATMTE